METFLGLSADAWTAIAAWVTAGILAATAVFVWRQLKEGIRLRQEQSRPWVIVDFDYPESWLIDLTIQNAGRTAAKDVKFQFEPELKRTFDEKPHRKEAGKEFSKTALIRDGLSTLPPGKTIRTLFDSSIDRKESGLPDKYTVTITYTDSTGRKMPPDTYILDLSPMWGMEFLDRKGIHHAAIALKDIHKEVKKWTHGIRGVEVFTSSTGAYNRRSNRWMKFNRDDQDAEDKRKRIRKLRMKVYRWMDRYGL